MDSHPYTVDFSLDDARKLSAAVQYDEVLLRRKRRWLDASTVSTDDGARKRSKSPKFLSNRLIQESFLRSDDVFPEVLKRYFENTSESFGDTGFHVVQDYLNFFSAHKLKSYSLCPELFLKDLPSIINDLNNEALYHLVKTVALNRINFGKTRPMMKKIINQLLYKAFTALNVQERLIFLNQISEIFKNPRNLQRKGLTVVTPLTPPLLSSIDKLLKGLDKVPFQTLDATNKKLRGVTGVPQFPVVLSTSHRKLLIQTVKRKCKKLLSSQGDQFYLPKPLAKALSVLQLSTKYITKCPDILTSEFYPFSLETLDIQNNILRALWSLDKVTHIEKNVLQQIVDPKAEIPYKTFRQAVRKYLVECLFECDDSNSPQELSTILAFINRRSRRQSCLNFKKAREEELEDVLNVSAHLKQVISSLLPDSKINNPPLENFASDNESEDNDFQLDGNAYCSNSICAKQLQVDSLYSEEETTGDNKIKLEQDSDDFASKSQSKNLLGFNLQDNLGVIQDICDETSLFAYKLIDQFLDKSTQMESTVDSLAKSYWRGTQTVEDSDGSKPSLVVPMEETLPLFFSQIVDGLLPSFHQRYPIDFLSKDFQT